MVLSLYFLQCGIFIFAIVVGREKKVMNEAIRLQHHVSYTFRTIKYMYVLFFLLLTQYTFSQPRLQFDQPWDTSYTWDEAQEKREQHRKNSPCGSLRFFSLSPKPKTFCLKTRSWVQVSTTEYFKEYTRSIHIPNWVNLPTSKMEWGSWSQKKNMLQGDRYLLCGFVQSRYDRNSTKICGFGCVLGRGNNHSFLQEKKRRTKFLVRKLVVKLLCCKCLHKWIVFNK